MTRYAERTKVSVSKSRTDIERELLRYGAEGFMFGHDHGRAMIAFRMHDRQVRMFLSMPDRDDPAVARTDAGRRRAGLALDQAIEQAWRQRWRALLLVVKAKLEAVESGVETFDEAFLPHIVLPSGATVGQWVEPQIEQAYETGRMPELLPGVAGELEAGA